LFALPRKVISFKTEDRLSVAEAPLPTASVKDIKGPLDYVREARRFKKLPKKYNDLSIIYEKWEADEVKGLLSTEEFEQYKELIKRALGGPVQYGSPPRSGRPSTSRWASEVIQAVKPGFSWQLITCPRAT
jgi:hypothetical protein